MAPSAFAFEVHHRRRQLRPPAVDASLRRTATVETPAFMPVGTQGTVKGVDPGRLRETGAADDPRQHVPLDAAAGRANRRRARRPARVHGLGRPDSHRQRRLPGLQPGRAHDRSTNTACVSARTSTAPWSSSRPSEPSPSRSSSAATSRWCSTTSSRCPADREAGRRRHARAALRWAERCQAAATRTRSGAVRDRARRARRRAAGRIGRAARGASTSSATQSAASASARSPPEMYAASTSPRRCCPPTSRAT